MIAKPVFALLAALALAGATLSCDDSSPSGPEGTSTVALLLTDDPDDLVHAWVDIEEVYLQGGADDAENDDAGGRVVLFSGPSGPIDLLTLADDFQQLAETDVPSRTYGQLRLVLTGAAIETEDGQVFATEGFDVPGGLAADGSLQCGSCGTSGLKVLLQGRDLSLDDAFETLIMDFEVGESFSHPAGQSGMWVVHPVIKLFDDPAEVE